MRWILGIWLVSTTALLSWLLGFHMVAFDKLNQAIAGESPESVFATSHFLSTECSCSEKVLVHLSQRGAIPEAHEQVYLIGESAKFQAQLQERGFQVSTLTEDEAAQDFGVAAVPLLRITKEGKTLYSGAYGKDQKHVPVYRDEDIIQDAIKGVPSEGMPLFGCISGKMKKKSFDLLGIFYDFAF